MEFYHENKGDQLNGFGRESNIIKSKFLHRILVASVANVLEGSSVPPRHRGRTTVVFPDREGRRMALPRTVLTCMTKQLKITGKEQENDQYEDLMAY